jgi:hypothetical protein
VTPAALALEPLDIRGASGGGGGVRECFRRFDGDHDGKGGDCGEEVSVENSRLLRNVMAG